MPEGTPKKVEKSVLDISLAQIKRGIIASIGWIVVTILYVIFFSSDQTPSDQISTWVVVLVIIGLTYLLANVRSRTAAWILLALFSLGLLLAFSSGGESAGIVGLLILIGYFYGVAGAYGYQKNKPPVPIPVEKWVNPTLGILAAISIFGMLYSIGTLDSNTDSTQSSTHSSAAPEQQLANKSDKQDSVSTQELYKQYGDAVLTVHIREADSEIQGSGVMLLDQGLLVTNYHVVKNISLTSSDFVTDAEGSIHPIQKVLAYDENLDLALVQVAGIRHNHIEMGNSDDLEIGEEVVAIGSPEGFENTISKGIVSSRRFIDGVEYLQITNPISHGSSGGALLNSQGKLVGITTWTNTEGQNLNFAVPSSYILKLIENLTDSTEQTPQN